MKKCFNARFGGSVFAASALLFGVSVFPVSAKDVPVISKVKEIGAGEFRGGLSNVCVSKEGNIYGCGGGMVKVFSADGNKTMEWKANNSASAIALGENGVVYVGGKCSDQTLNVEKVTVGGDGKTNVAATWKVGKAINSRSKVKPEPGKADEPAISITSLKVNKDTLFVGDASGRSIHKFSLTDGKYDESIGLTKGKPNGMIATCCGILDFDVNANGDIVIANLGQHRVTVCNKDGKNAKSWGSEGKKPEDFCGCCNPVSVAVCPNGYIVTGEKTIPRIKIYSENGNKLLGITGSGDFNPDCSDLAVAVDDKLNLYVADGHAKCIKVFAASTKKE